MLNLDENVMIFGNFRKFSENFIFMNICINGFDDSALEISDDFFSQDRNLGLRIRAVVTACRCI